MRSRPYQKNDNVRILKVFSSIIFKMKKILFEIFIISFISLLIGFSYAFFKKIDLFPESTEVYLFSKKYPEIRLLNTGEVLKIYKRENVVIIDARDRISYSQGHIKGAINIPYDEFELYPEFFLDLFKNDKQLIIYCEGGYCEQSFIVAERLLKMGFKNVHVYIDGYPEWEKKGLPHEKVPF